MKNITVKDGITVIERKILEEYIFLRSYFSLFASFISNTRVRFALLCTPWFYHLTLWAYSAWAQVVGKLVQRWNWWNTRTVTDRQTDRETDTPRDGSKISLQFFLPIREGYKSKARLRTMVRKRRR